MAIALGTAFARLNAGSSTVKRMFKGSVGIWNADAADWINRVQANDGTVSTATANAVTNFCNSIDAAGIRDKFYRLNLFCGTGLNACLVPLYRGPIFGGTQYGNTTDTNNGPFVSGDYAESVGLTKNVLSTKYLDTGLAPEDLASLATGHIAAYRGSGAAANQAIIGLRDSGETHYYELFKRGDSKHHGAWGGTSLALAATESAHEDAGLLLVSRTSSTSLTLYRDGVSIGTQAASIVPAGTDRNWFVFALNAGSPTSLWAIDIPVMGYSIGNGLDAGQAASFNSAMQTLQSSLGRA